MKRDACAHGDAADGHSSRVNRVKDRIKVAGESREFKAVWRSKRLGSPMPPAIKRQRTQANGTAQDALGLRNLAPETMLKHDQRATRTAHLEVEPNSVGLKEGHSNWALEV